ncbi:MAG: DUF4153 domain-containing protein, partial [Synergistaceae bacterium]|nr:DUF4153 domain-containing protein [Synergistaceae bacterium]
ASSAVVQGILLGMYVVMRTAYIPLTAVLLVPFVFWLSQEHWGRRLWNLLIGLTLVLALLWGYRIWSYGGAASFPSQSGDLVRVSMAVFILIPYFQCRIASWSWNVPYSDVFFQLCRNLFLLFQASIVIAVFWGLLVTAGLLFDIVGLEAVPRVIFNPVAAVPMTMATIAISISVAIKHPGIDSLGRWLLAVLAWLLPFFSVLSVMFILSLLVSGASGLKSLWNTGQASTLMLFLQFGTIILANAAWLDGSKSAFRTKSIDLLAQVSLLCLPVYSVLCLYSLNLRIGQYGLTPERVQAVFLASVTGVWGLSYAVAVLMGKWPLKLGKVNMWSALIMAGAVILMNTPVLDPLRLSASNQALRLYSGKISPEDFDYLYARFSLGRYGVSLLRGMSEHESGAVREAAISALSDDSADYDHALRRHIIAQAHVYPKGAKLPDGFGAKIAGIWDKRPGILFQGNEPSSPGDIAFVRVNIGRDSVIVFTQDGGAVFGADGKYVGMIAGKFELSELGALKPIASEMSDIDIRGRTYRIITPPKY